MARFSLNKLPKEQRIQLIGEFYDVIASLKSREEVRAFFRDLLAPDEIAMLMRRVEIAALLLGGFTYEKVQEYTGVGRATITSVYKKLMRDEDICGYRIVIERLLAQRKKRMQQTKRSQKAREDPFQKLKQSKPIHFLLFNILDALEERRERSSSEFTQRALLHTPSRRLK